jgi:predicted aspartyl protease
LLSQAPGPVITIEGIVIDVIIHREPNAATEDGVPDFHESGAMIDTGASDTCVDYRIAHALKLRQIDQRTIGTVGGPVQVAVFLGVLEIPQLQYKKLTRFFAPRIERINYSVLIGRSVLREYIFTYDGPANLSHFARPQAPLEHADDYAS